MTDPKSVQTVTIDHHNDVVDYLVAVMATANSHKVAMPPAPAGFTLSVRRGEANSMFGGRGRLEAHLLDHRGNLVRIVGYYMDEEQVVHCAARFGFTIERVKSTNPKFMAAPKWVGVCPACSKRFPPSKRRSSNMSCATCSPTFDERFLLVWEQLGAEPTVADSAVVPATA